MAIYNSEPGLIAGYIRPARLLGNTEYLLKFGEATHIITFYYNLLQLMNFATQTFCAHLKRISLGDLQIGNQVQNSLI